jgi:hemerythrin-like domain-containing protein
MKEFTQIGQRLHEEHEQTLILLNAFEGELLSRPANKPLNTTDAEVRRLLQQLIDVLRQDVHRHFRFEENELFPLLREKGAGDIAEMLIHEHEVIRPIADTLIAGATAALADGFDLQSWGEFRLGVIDLMERESFHIQKEEMGLVRSLAYFLEPEADGALALRYAEYAG